MSILTVIGVGNRLYCDDGIGCELTEALSEQNKDRYIDYIVSEADREWCLAQITTPHIILLDAVQMGRKPGSIGSFRLEDVLPRQLGISMHNGHMLSLLQADTIKEGLLIGIEPYELALFYGLSEPMRRNFEKVIVAVQKIISDYAYVWSST